MNGGQYQWDAQHHAKPLPATKSHACHDQDGRVKADARQPCRAEIGHEWNRERPAMSQATQSGGTRAGSVSEPRMLGRQPRAAEAIAPQLMEERAGDSAVRR